MTRPPVKAIDVLCVDTIQMTQALGQVSFPGFDERMVMVGHLTIGMAQPIVPSACLSGHFQKFSPVRRLKKDVMPTFPRAMM